MSENTDPNFEAVVQTFCTLSRETWMTLHRGELVARGAALLNAEKVQKMRVISDSAIGAEVSDETGKVRAELSVLDQSLVTTCTCPGQVLWFFANCASSTTTTKKWLLRNFPMCRATPSKVVKTISQAFVLRRTKEAVVGTLPRKRIRDVRLTTSASLCRSTPDGGGERGACAETGKGFGDCSEMSKTKSLGVGLLAIHACARFVH